MSRFRELYAGDRPHLRLLSPARWQCIGRFHSGEGAAPYAAWERWADQVPLPPPWSLTYTPPPPTLAERLRADIDNLWAVLRR